nr:immunoglobulin heavy chain junction region [Macaca mulatta]MOV86617.1 immunoglobulin heavy chain junction region [Macaca mulatta]MOV86624.1 immunoglobulin heavy chain junction region [Macaca mulatta]MOV86679.1 immunoglobulin heavy chain junction region [Macaca mulatta]MOV86700.1 immunoglobulin heavy chain junction region [Macaca mulatta]
CARDFSSWKGRAYW